MGEQVIPKFSISCFFNGMIKMFLCRDMGNFMIYLIKIMYGTVCTGTSQGRNQARGKESRENRGKERRAKAAVAFRVVCGLALRGLCQED